MDKLGLLLLWVSVIQEFEASSQVRKRNVTSSAHITPETFSAVFNGSSLNKNKLEENNFETSILRPFYEIHLERMRLRSGRINSKMFNNGIWFAHLLDYVKKTDDIEGCRGSQNRKELKMNNVFKIVNVTNIDDRKGCFTDTNDAVESKMFGKGNVDVKDQLRKRREASRRKNKMVDSSSRSILPSTDSFRSTTKTASVTRGRFSNFRMFNRKSVPKRGSRGRGRILVTEAGERQELETPSGEKHTTWRTKKLNDTSYEWLQAIRKARRRKGMNTERPLERKLKTTTEEKHQETTTKKKKERCCKCDQRKQKKKREERQKSSAVRVEPIFRILVFNTNVYNTFLIANLLLRRNMYQSIF